MEMESSNRNAGRPFFSISYWARLVLMTLLMIVFLSTSGQAIWDLVHASSLETLTMVEVSEALTSNHSAIYNLSLQNDQDELEFVRLRNNGRILNYLLAQDNIGHRRVVVEQKAGEVYALTFLDGAKLTIRESRIAPAIQLVIGLFPLLIFLFHIRPKFIE